MSRRPRALALAAVVASTLAACSGERGPGEWVEVDGGRIRPLAVTGSGPDGFEVLEVGRTGLDAANTVAEALALDNRTLADGSGVAIGDFDADGLPDIFIPRVAEPSVLYRNLGDLRFEDVTGSAGAGLGERHATGAAFLDVDGDGDLDLVVAVLGGSNVLLRNEGGSFTDASADAGFEVARASRSFAVADADGDGDLDLYFANNKTRVARDLFPPEERTRERIVLDDGGQCGAVPDVAEHWEVRCFGPAASWLERAEPDEFYLNDGSGRFELVPFTGGRFLDVTGAPLAEAPTDWGLSVRFKDLDADGAQDLWVCNDFETPDRIWMNDGTGTFTAASPESVRTTSLACMAIDFADVDRDGVEDVFTADMEPLGRSRRLRTVPPMPSDTTPPGAIDTRVQRARNTLQLGRGDGTFSDVARFAGVDGSEWTWASMFVDVDLDGHEDLLAVTGHVWDLLDGDVGQRVAAARASVDWREEQRLYPPMPIRNLAFRNRGDGTFEEHGETWRFSGAPDISHGMAAGDLDLDGDPDIVITRLNEPPLVLRNLASAPRVAVRLAGARRNPSGIGATIRVSGVAVPVQLRQVAVTRSYLSGSEPLYAFATGDAASVDVEVRWPGGAVSRVEGIEPGHLVEVYESQATAGGGAGGGRGVGGPAVEPVFRQVPLAHSHVEVTVPELVRQPLLAERLAQPGPGVSAIDVDRDGDADIAIAAGRGGRTALFLNEDGALVAAPDAGQTAPFDQTTILPSPDGAGAMDLLIGVMSYEASAPADAMRAAGVVRRVGVARAGATDAEVVPGGLESVGALATADVDGDGDLDLFVAGRAFPGRYPAPVSSRLFLNDGDGAWRPHAVFNTLLDGVGVVSAARFTDIDGDGDPDLALALDWGPIRVYRNDGGRFTDATRTLGLDALTGRWNGLAAGDLDEDGRLDLVATSWGLNTGLEASAEHPLLVYHGDLDGNGTYESLRARYDETVGGVAPLEPLPRLLRAFPVVGRMVGSFGEYATSPIETILGPAAGQAQVSSASTLAHTLLLNRGDRFEAVELPREAQMAPGFYVGVADHDGDGHDDVFLTQNFFATVPGEARHDAGRSLWLAGDGSGGLTSVPGAISGVAVYGDPRGAALADLDGDARVDLVVSQNGGPTKLYMNAGAAPGLRVRLVGPPANPDAIGAAVRVLYEDGAGPLREVAAGSGYWSVDDAVQVLGLRAEPRAVRVRWPGGAEREVPVEPGAREVTIARGVGS
ncbi:MAG: FG-GAP-like repeat-containing protein [Gemmatimonadota bacterium]|nr:FG-GAP-like repeat-containing protein [Gemmatimonadota bacterium]